MKRQMYTNEYVVKDGFAELIIKNIEKQIVVTSMIDIEDIDKCKKKIWNVTSKNYVVSSNKRIRLHRYVMDYNGPLQVDHINRNRLDNRKENLRIVSGFINNQNNSCVGVSFDKHAKKWKAEFQRFGKAYYVGIFDTKKEAIKARQKAIKEFESQNTNKLLYEYKTKDTNHITGIRPSPHGKWVAKLCMDNKTYHIGTFNTKEEAIAARNAAIEGRLKRVWAS